MYRIGWLRSTFLTNYKSKINCAMSGQAKILSFFSPKQKRQSESNDGEGDIKKPKLDNKQTSVDNGKEIDGSKEIPQIPLSPEQKRRIEENKQKAIAKLQSKQTGSITVNVGESWRKAFLQDEFSKSYFESLSKFVESERKKGTVYPTPENVFSWTRACTVNDVKVVILGQDPYHGPNQAHGLSFSVLPGVTPPPSLVNMYKELEKDIEGFHKPPHGYLMGWAKQGVLMLNSVLTVKAHRANSHKDKGWEKLTDATISYLNKNRSRLVFILWGSYAQKKGAHIDKKKHCILEEVHPSPLSAHRGFFGCKHFSKCNQYLTDNGKSPIDWSDLPEHIS